MWIISKTCINMLDKVYIQRWTFPWKKWWILNAVKRNGRADLFTTNTWLRIMEFNSTCTRNRSFHWKINSFFFHFSPRFLITSYFYIPIKISKSRMRRYQNLSEFLNTKIYSDSNLHRKWDKINIKNVKYTQEVLIENIYLWLKIVNFLSIHKV